MSTRAIAPLVSIIALTASFVLRLPDAAAADPLPPKVQAAVFKKIFNYDYTLRPGEPIKVLIVATDETLPQAKALALAFEEVGVSSEVVSLAKLENSPRPFAVYVFPATAEAARAFCDKHKVISVTGFSELADIGSAGIAVVKSSTKEIAMTLNLSRVKSDGHKYSASFLSVVRIIQ